jgi:YVTN family beta-propeller protein
MKKAILSLTSLVLFTLSTFPVRADSVLTSITVGAGPIGVAANPRTNKIYVGVSNLGQVAVIDGKTQQVIDRINAGGGLVAVNVITNRIYSSRCSFNTASCNIAVINGNNDKVVANIPIASGSFIGLQGLAVNPVTNLIYASDADNSQYIVIDGKTNTIVTQVAVFTQPSGIAVNPKTNRIYVGGGGFPGLLIVYDGASNAELARITENSSVQGVATNFVLNRAYAGVQQSQGPNVLAVVDGATNQQIAEVPTGQFCNGVDVNLANNKIYVANSNDATVTIIDGNTNQVLQTLPVPAVFATDVGVNSATGLTYVTDGSSDKVIVLQQN